MVSSLVLRPFAESLRGNLTMKKTSRSLPVPALLKGLLVLSALMISSQAKAQNNIGSLDDRCKTYDYSTNDGYGVYKVQAGQSTDEHDPRIERTLSPKIYANKGDYTFQARYNIANADLSTIAQILNYDGNSTDTNQPVIFINAKSNGSNWDIYCKERKFYTVAKNANGNQPTFVLKLITNGEETRIYVNGSLKTTYKHARIGQHSTMRYGCYHHGSGTAQIRVKDVTFTAPPGAAALTAPAPDASSGPTS